MQQNTVPPPAPMGKMPGRQEWVYTGTWQELFVLLLVQGILTVITFYIYYPWAYCAIRKWTLEHTYAENRQLTFVGNGGEFFGIVLVQLLLTAVTFGIWGFLQIPTQKFLEFDVKNTRFM